MRQWHPAHLFLSIPILVNTTYHCLVGFCAAYIKAADAPPSGPIGQ